MAVSRYFGLPGCGKTTTLAMLAYKARCSCRYKNIYCNVDLALDGVTYVPFDVFGVYELRDCLLLVDEAAICCGDRDYKNFGKEKLKEFMLHRHKDCDIVLFSQEASGVDKKIRSITDRMFYVKKGLFLGKWITNIYRIPYDVMFPESGDNLGDILMGYKKPSILSRLTARRIIRSKYYQFFDSWESDVLPPLPAKFQAYQDDLFQRPSRYIVFDKIRYLYSWYSKTVILLRSLFLPLLMFRFHSVSSPTTIRSTYKKARTKGRAS